MARDGWETLESSIQALPGGRTLQSFARFLLARFGLHRHGAIFLVFGVACVVASAVGAFLYLQGARSSPPEAMIVGYVLGLGGSLMLLGAMALVLAGSAVRKVKRFDLRNDLDAVRESVLATAHGASGRS